MSIIDCIKDKCPCALVSDCSEGPIKIEVDVNDYVILKGEKMCKDRKICDHIVFTKNNEIFVFVVEFKSRNVGPRDIEEKFTNCYEKAREILESVGIFRYDFCYIVIAKNWRSIERMKISQMRLPFSGKREIIVKKTGVTLSSIISEFCN